jgi:basic membrane protein A
VFENSQIRSGIQTITHRLYVRHITPLLACACLLAACGDKAGAPAQPQSSAATPGAASGALKVGFIYVGPRDDYGYNQAHHEGALEIAKLPNVSIIEEERVPEAMEVQKTMESMVKLEHASVLFPTSFGYYDPHILKVAAKLPDVTFLHCGGMYDASKHPSNVGSYFGYIDEAEYINGIVAASTSKSKKLGFIAAKPIPQVLRNINAFTLGARSVDPSITTTVVFTGDWSLPVKEADAANGLIDQGVDVLTSHVDSPKVVVQTAEKRGIYSVGYHTSQASLAPKGYLTGAEWNWGKVYTNYVETLRAGKPLDHLVRGGLKDGFVKNSPYGPAVSTETKAAADAAKAKIMSGELVIFQGELKDNAGKVVIGGGAQMPQRDPALESMSYLVEGVVGSTGVGS